MIGSHLYNSLKNGWVDFGKLTKMTGMPWKKVQGILTENGYHKIAAHSMARANKSINGEQHSLLIYHKDQNIEQDIFWHDNGYYA